MLRRLPTVVTCVAALLVGGCGTHPPDIVLITVDTLRADHLGCYGKAGNPSPVIDAAAARGVCFDDASTTMPRTSQAVASLFTSLHPATHGVHEIGQALNDVHPSLPELLHEAGYTTAAVSANPVAGPRQGLDRGFSRFVDRDELARRHGLRNNLDGPNPAGMGPAEAVTAQALSLAETAGDAPLFLWLLYMDPHWPYNPPAPYNEVVDWSRFHFYRDMRRFSPPRASVYFNLNGRAAAAQDELSRLYAAEVRYVDTMIGRLLAGLDERRRGRPRMLVVTADHGESLGENGYFYQHGALVDQPCMRVPLIVSLPAVVPAGMRIEEPVSLLDVAPTILQLAGLVAPAGFAGHDLRPLWQGEVDHRPSAVSGESGTIVYPQNPIRSLGGRASDGLRFVRDGRWVAVEQDGELRLFDVQADPALTVDLSDRQPQESARLFAQLAALPAGGDRWRMLRDGRWKLVRIPSSDGISWKLFDLATDPLESTDLAAREPQLVARLKPLLERAPAIVHEANAPGTVADDVRSQLRALGYVND